MSEAPTAAFRTSATESENSKYLLLVKPRAWRVPKRIIPDDSLDFHPPSISTAPGSGCSERLRRSSRQFGTFSSLHSFTCDVLISNGKRTNAARRKKLKKFRALSLTTRNPFALQCLLDCALRCLISVSDGPYLQRPLLLNTGRRFHNLDYSRDIERTDEYLMPLNAWGSSFRAVQGPVP